jgi:asparagine synthetase B (glutamine-hydrolysing)
MARGGWYSIPREVSLHSGIGASYADGRYWLVFNGETYNYIELRRELEAAGRVFHKQSDSEVLVAAYAQWGESSLHRLFGMFAFLIWDAREQRLFAARDRFGIKPLYWVETPRARSMQRSRVIGRSRERNIKNTIFLKSKGTKPNSNG